MKIDLKEYPKNVTIIQGFPGFGMVGSVATEFLLEHLKVRSIGDIVMDELPPVVAIHKGQIIPPVGIYYNEKHNIVILNFLTKAMNQEWKFAELVEKIAEMLEAKEIISLEGVSAQGGLQDDKGQKSYVFANSEDKLNALKDMGFEAIQESIIMGVSAALMMHKTNMTSFFATTASTLPDSNAAAEIIKCLDKYLNLEVDYNPLYEQAKEFEAKIKEIMSKSKSAVSEQERSMLNYMG